MAVHIAVVFTIFSIFVIGGSLVATLVPPLLNNGGANLPCPIPTTCIPQDIVITDLTVTGNVECPPGSGGIGRDCLPLVVETINTIAPWSNNSDFEIVAVHGIEATGLPHGIMLRNTGKILSSFYSSSSQNDTGLLGIVFLSPHPEFNGTLVDGVLFLKKNDQLANTFFAGPESGPDAQPIFRYLIDADIPYISAYKVNGTLQVDQGGTNSTTPLVGGHYMISFDGAIIEGPALFSNGTASAGISAGPGIEIEVINGTFVITATPRITSVDMTVPPRLVSPLST